MTLYYYKFGCKSRGVGDKNPQKKAGNFGVGFNSPAEHETNRLV